MNFLISFVILGAIMWLAFYLIANINKILEETDPRLSGGEIVGMIILNLLSRKNFAYYVKASRNFFNDMLKTLKKAKDERD